MPTPSFSETERYIRNLFPIGSKFTYKNSQYEVMVSGKPSPPRGECKTDVYILAKNTSLETREFKISVKQDNANFLENKMSLDRALEIFGEDAQAIIAKSIKHIRKAFENDFLICFDGYKKTEAKSIKLGWKFELLNIGSGKSEMLKLSDEQKIDVFSGNNLSIEKKDSYVNGKVINNSGVANYIIFVDHENLPTSANQVMKLIQDIDSYSKTENIYFACKALNYRASVDKWDGNRPLSVSVNWSIKDGMLHGELDFDHPLGKKGNEIGKNLQLLLEQLNISADNFDSLLNKIDDSVTYYKER